MKTRVEIDTKTFVRFWLVIAGLLLAAYALYSARTALLLLGTAVFLALALNRPVTSLAEILPGKSRIGGTAIAYVIVVVFLGGFLVLVVPPIIEQTAKVVETIPSLITNAQEQWDGANDFIHRYGLEGQVNSAVETLQRNVTSWAAAIGTNLISSVNSLFQVLFSTFLVLVLSFLMLIEGPSWLKRMWRIYTDQDKMKHHQQLAAKMYTVVTGYVTGQLAVSGIGAFFAGFTVFIMSFVFNIPHNFALPTVAIAFVLSLIPMFGSTIAGVLICLLLAFNDISSAVVFAVYFIIYQQVENNFISPTIQAKTVELSALTVLVSVTVGIYVLGIAGAVISIPVAGSIKVLLEDYLARRRPKSQSLPHKLIKKLHNEA